MNNKYEERLGTERMLPLVFKMALPAVAAQFVNLLYSIVDRIYIGHIPGIGTDALAGVGVTTSLIILISSFSEGFLSVNFTAFRFSSALLKLLISSSSSL